MTTLRVKKMVLDQFKGVSHTEYDFDDTFNLVTGRNGSGKTTIADAYTWVFDAKSHGYSLDAANISVVPDHNDDAQPSVTLKCDINGEEVELRKWQKDKRTKKDKDNGYKFDGQNNYEINSVPCNQKTFFKKLEEYGVDTESFILFTNPNAFLGKKQDECRKILFSMAKDMSDKDIADLIPGCEDISEMLDKMPLSDIEKLSKTKRSEAERKIKSLNEQIVGKAQEKVAIDVNEQTARKEALQNEINALEQKIKDLRVPSIGELNQQVAYYNLEAKSIIAEANSERLATLTEIDAIIDGLKSKYKDHTDKLAQLAIKLNDAQRDKTEAENRYDALSREFQDVKLQRFEIADTTCPYCGQDLPTSRIEEAKKKFEQEREERKLTINLEAKELASKKDEIESTISQYEQAVTEENAKATALAAEITEKQKERSKYEDVIDAKNSDEYRKILQKISEVQETINRRDELVVQEEALYAQISDKKDEICDCDGKLTLANMNERIDESIANAKREIRETAQEEVDASRILDKIADINMKKNELLTGQINSNFQMVKFKFFDYLKKDNGERPETKPVCTPTIENKHGVVTSIGSSANTALETLGKIDIITGLQKFAEQYYTIFLDGCESLDAESMKQLHADAQLIGLAVSDTDLYVQEGR